MKKSSFAGVSISVLSIDLGSGAVIMSCTLLGAASMLLGVSEHTAGNQEHAAGSCRCCLLSVGHSLTVHCAS